MQFIYSKRFKKELSKAPIKIQSAVADRLKIFAQNTHHPLLNNHSLSGAYADHRSINITGDYRVVFQALSDNICYLVAVGTHAKLYK